MRLAIGMPVIGSRFGILAGFLTSLTSAVIRIKVRSYILKAFNAAGFISHLIEGRGARGSRCRVPNRLDMNHKRSVLRNAAIGIHFLENPPSRPTVIRDFLTRHLEHTQAIGFNRAVCTAQARNAGLRSHIGFGNRRPFLFRNLFRLGFVFRFRYRFRLSHFLFGSRERIGLRLVLVILRPVRNRNIKCGVIRCIEFRILGFVLRIGFICRIGFRYILCIGILTARVILAVIVAVLCIRFRPGFIDRLSHRTATGLLFCGLLDLNDLCRSGFCLDRGLRFRRHIAFRIPGPTGLPYRIRQAIRRRGFNLFGRSAAGFRSRRIRAVICAARRSRFTGRTDIAGRCGSRYRSTRPGTASAVA